MTSLLLDRDPHLAVVGVCRAGNDARIALAMRAGARGCVDGDIDGPELARAVIAAGRGQAILSGPVLRGYTVGCAPITPKRSPSGSVRCAA